MNTKTTTYYFYKGTCFPMEVQGDDSTETVKLANEMIKDELYMGLSLKDQIKDYKEQLDKIENSLCSNEYIFNKNPKIGIELIEKELGHNWKTIYSIWRLYICALLKLKAISNDENYGLLIKSDKPPN